MSTRGLPAPPGNSTPRSRPSACGRERAPRSQLRRVRAGEVTHTHSLTQRGAQPAARAGSHHAALHIEPRSPGSIPPQPHAHPEGPRSPRVQHLHPPQAWAREQPHCLPTACGTRWPRISYTRLCCSPRPCSPPAPPRGSRWSPLPSAWPAQCGRPGRRSHRSASHRLWVAEQLWVGPRLFKATAPAARVS